MKLLCTHGNLDPHAVNMVKRVSVTGAQGVINMCREAEGNVRLTNESLCRTCVENTHTRQQAAEILMADQELVKDCLEAAGPGHKEGYWVGKESLRQWLKKPQVNPSKGGAPSAGKQAGEVAAAAEAAEAKGEDTDSVDTQKQGVLNSEILCPHDGLAPGTGISQIVPQQVWEILKKHHPDAVEIPAHTNICQECSSEDKDKTVRTKALRKRAKEEKTRFARLLKAQQTEFTQFKNDIVNLYIIPMDFVASLKRFIKSPDLGPPCPLDLSYLLCPHGNLLYNVAEINNPNVLDNTYLVTEDEWASLREYRDEKTREISTVWTNRGEFITSSIAPCREGCVEARQKELEDVQLVYENATIYVKVIKNDGKQQDKQQNGVVEKENEKVEKMDVDGSPPESKEPAEHEENGTTTAEEYVPRKSGRKRVPAQPLVDEGTRSHPKRVRDSTRKSVVVSSNTTVKELKIKLYSVLNASPVDQHLSFEGRPLEHDQTMAAARIFPGSVLEVRVDVANITEDDIIAASIAAARSEERGFSGTGLLGGR
eukprot:comp20848_c1_seq2/m.27570 comp20848_c1_seq2/g.27570  ORF comp20848_c1_seq2/g.27570 comp20848_c1_seq2/m.27570 type:complete len:540 (-) comp20848_c1_seq2:110-1729(-)